MRIHTNNPEQVRLAIIEATNTLPGVYATITTHGSRSHVGAIELRLEGNGYQTNSGKRGASDTIGATWDEWGVVLAYIFRADNDAVAGSVKYPVYLNSYWFHVQTADRFVGLALPEDTHRRHSWESVAVRVRKCRKCSASVMYN